MITQRTHGVDISVQTSFQPLHSEPHQGKFLHKYLIVIENHNDFTIQLLRRHWHITEGDGSIKIVDGEGVIGRQPILLPGESHTYNSFCVLQGEIGMMEGFYSMLNIDKGEDFLVEIPGFVLIVPYRLN